MAGMREKSSRWHENWISMIKGGGDLFPSPLLRPGQAGPLVDVCFRKWRQSSPKGRQPLRGNDLDLPACAVRWGWYRLSGRAEAGDGWRTEGLWDQSTVTAYTIHKSQGPLALCFSLTSVLTPTAVPVPCHENKLMDMGLGTPVTDASSYSCAETLWLKTRFWQVLEKNPLSWERQRHRLDWDFPPSVTASVWGSIMTTTDRSPS